MTDSRTYCAREVRRADHERYLAALFAPDARRPALMALYAFDIELARIAGLVSEPMLGRIRLRWWREAIEGIYSGAPRAHPVVEELFRVVGDRGLGRARLERMIDTRERDLEPDGFADLEAMEDYAAGSAGALCALSLEALGAADAATLARARRAGLAWGLAGLLRAQPSHAGRRRLTLPRSLLDRAGVSAEQVFSGAPPARLRDAVAPVARAARRHIEAAGRCYAGPARAALLPLVLAERYLDRLERRGFDVFARGLEAGALGRQLRLTWAALRGR